MSDSEPTAKTGRRQTQAPDAPQNPGRESGNIRAGDDIRRRGWFWHWNGIITQYTPLIGLKGIGLLNSYTAWTDRRENSPHRGYAFPSQQSEANFYGEDRSELITINKILVALDLIEIHKEMVRKVDAQGRRWKVPHNFYRVKDRAEGLDLTATDVIRVVELAARDAAVYRYIRKVFSEKFEPIDRANTWHGILQELEAHPTWQKLSAKARKQDARASARTKAGHRSRKSQSPPKNTTQAEPAAGSDGQASDRSRAEMTNGHNNNSLLRVAEHRAGSASNNQTYVDVSNIGLPAVDEQPNTGSGANSAQTNNGSVRNEGGNVEQPNTGNESTVEQSNTTYYQENTTTTTTTSAVEKEQNANGDAANYANPATRQSAHSAQLAKLESTDSAAPDQEHAPSIKANSGAEPSAGESGGEALKRGPARKAGGGPLGDPTPLVVSLFEAANDRASSRLERILLSELEQDADPAARASGSTGAEWVAEALREAVGSGSTFVAPKRIREIINRWATDGHRPTRRPLASPPVVNSDTLQAAQIWECVLVFSKQALEECKYLELFSSSRLVHLSEGRAEVRVRDDGTAQRLAQEYRALVEQALAHTLGHPISVTFSADRDVNLETLDAGQDASVIALSADDAERGRQLWQLVLNDLSPLISQRDHARIRNVLPLGQSADDRFLLGVPGRHAEQACAGHCRAQIEHVLTQLFETEILVDIVGQQGWMISS